jgi:hypothetical protein
VAAAAAPATPPMQAGERLNLLGLGPSWDGHYMVVAAPPAPPAPPTPRKPGPARRRKAAAKQIED